MPLFASKNLSKDELLGIARQICQQYDWPWLEPVHIQNRLFTWTVVTGYDMVGCNARVTISKRTGRPIRWSYIPR
jgi:hypothetical protein